MGICLIKKGCNMNMFFDRVRVLLTYGDQVDWDIGNLVILDDIEISKDYLKLSLLIETNNALRQSMLPDEIKSAKIQAFINESISFKEFGLPVELNNLVLEDVITKRNKVKVFVNEYIYKIKG